MYTFVTLFHVRCCAIRRKITRIQSNVRGIIPGLWVRVHREGKCENGEIIIATRASRKYWEKRERERKHESHRDDAPTLTLSDIYYRETALQQQRRRRRQLQLAAASASRCTRALQAYERIHLCRGTQAVLSSPRDYFPLHRALAAALNKNMARACRR